MANLTCAPYGGVVHYTTGAAGHPFSMEPVLPSTYMDHSILHEWGYSVFDAPNATAMHLGWYCNHNNTLCDSKWIYHSPAAAAPLRQ